MKFLQRFLIVTIVLAIACNDDDPSPVNREELIYQIPVVVHVIHMGEQEGEGTNLSRERILGQIRVLNEDYRRKEGTPGFNNHPDGGDARIEFVLARSTPDGQPTDGIVRINYEEVDNPIPPQQRFNYYAYFSYWDPKHYLNIWTEPFPELANLLLGQSTGPVTDLPGGDSFQTGEPMQADGVLVNAVHFGLNPDIESDYNLGRTLTHEIGHYLGLLHPWGKRDCEHNDYCNDTPAVTSNAYGCPTVRPLGCKGEPVMIENYMDYTADRCMNIFTNDQIARMRYVLEHSEYRKTLVTSPGLSTP